MSLYVLGEMVAAHKLPVANTADELLLARVDPLVSREFVGAGEAAQAVVELADKRSLARVDANVGFQVAGLEVVLAALWVVALVHAPSLRRRSGYWGTGGSSCCGSGKKEVVIAGRQQDKLGRARLCSGAACVVVEEGLWCCG